jgi:endoplasmic reticulum junction formation protein lunapark
LEEVGKWKCGECGAWNSVENDAAYVAQEMKPTLQNEQVEGGGITSKGPKEEPEQAQIEGVAELGADTRKVENGVQDPAREIPDSEEDADDEEKDARPARDVDGGEQENMLAERRLTRSTDKQNAKKQK